MADTEQVYALKKQLRKLSAFQGSGTELISVYIPAGSAIHDMTGKLREEMSQASNIKSKSTRTNVIGALERIVHHLKIYKHTPHNGIAVFCGNVSDNPSKEDIELFSLEPPQPLQIGMYRCDSRFFLDPLRSMTDVTDSYGIVVMDGREATLALVRGTIIRVVKRLNSTAHAKIRKGGQCLSGDTVLFCEDGELTEIKDFKKENKLVGLDFNEVKTKPANASDFFVTSANNSFLLKSECPLCEIRATPYHRFFVLSEYGVKEKFAKDLDRNDRILIARKINCKEKEAMINPVGRYNKIKVPECWTKELARLCGIICGDGSADRNRIIIYEGKREVVDSYCSLIQRLLGVIPAIRIVDKTKQKGSFAKRQYYEIRIYSKEFVDLINEIAKETVSSERDVPAAITACKEEIIAAFLSGLYDAEGYIHGKRVDIAMISKKLMQKVQLLLLRLGIISSFSEKTVKGRKQWYVSISDLDSLNAFEDRIGFIRTDKRDRLKQICKRHYGQQYIDQIPIDGREVYAFAKALGLKTSDFHAASCFFRNKKPMGRQVFLKNILVVFEKQRNHEMGKRIFEYLWRIYCSDVTITTIKEKIHVQNRENFYDITVPVHSNFVANGFVVHNSARRYERLIEESIEKYYIRVGFAMDEHFLNKVKGVIVGGPGPTKDFFMKASPFNYQIKVMGIVDTGYTDEYGIREVLAKSENIIAQQEAVKERALVERFIKEVVSDGLATYGVNEVKEAIVSKQADMLLVSEELEYNIGFYACMSCNEVEEFIFKGTAEERRSCKKCNGEAKLTREELLLEYLVTLAKDNNIKVEIISTNTTEGAQFQQGFAGIGAFLRYKLR